MPRQKKSLEKKIFESPFFVVIIFIIILLTISGMIKMFHRAQRIKVEIATLQESIEELKEENQSLSDKRRYYSSEHFVEKEARLRLNLKKQGEEVIFINYDEEEIKKQKNISSRYPLVINFLDWWSYFFEPKNE